MDPAHTEPALIRVDRMMPPPLETPYEILPGTCPVRPPDMPLHQGPACVLAEGHDGVHRTSRGYAWTTDQQYTLERVPMEPPIPDFPQDPEARDALRRELIASHIAEFDMNRFQEMFLTGTGANLDVAARARIRLSMIRFREDLATTMFDIMERRLDLEEAAWLVANARNRTRIGIEAKLVEANDEIMGWLRRVLS
jgi:hypothetical protein